MMVEKEVKGTMRLCFMVKQGEANDVVIPIDYLQGIDYKRISEIEAKGGELMKAMRETSLDNGRNALDQYKDLLCVVKKESKVPSEKGTTDVAPVKRGRGRPRKNS